MNGSGMKFIRTYQEERCKRKLWEERSEKRKVVTRKTGTKY
jgi:hypothetical protein